MTLSTLLGILFGSLGAICMNVGKGVQKMKVHVWKQGLRPAFAPHHRRDLGIWLVGYSMTAGASIFLSLGLLFEDASVVSATTGVGLVALAIFSGRVLEERIGPLEMGGIGVVIVGTTMLALLGAEQPQPTAFDLPVLGVAIAILVATFALPVLFATTTGRLHGVVFGLLAGTLMGLSMTLGKVALVAAAALDTELSPFFAQLMTPYPYLALTAGTGALVVTQVAFFKGRAVVVVPCINSVMILAPALIERRLFGSALETGQYAALAVIILGVVVISSGRDDTVSDGRAPAAAGEPA